MNFETFKPKEENPISKELEEVEALILKEENSGKNLHSDEESHEYFKLIDRKNELLGQLGEKNLDYARHEEANKLINDRKVENIKERFNRPTEESASKDDPSFNKEITDYFNNEDTLSKQNEDETFSKESKDDPSFNEKITDYFNNEDTLSKQNEDETFSKESKDDPSFNEKITDYFNNEDNLFKQEDDENLPNRSEEVVPFNEEITDYFNNEDNLSEQNESKAVIEGAEIIEEGLNGEYGELSEDKKSLFKRFKEALKNKDTQKKIILISLAVGVSVTVPGASIMMGGGLFGLGAGLSVPFFEALGLASASAAFGGPLGAVILFSAVSKGLGKVFKKKEEEPQGSFGKYVESVGENIEAFNDEKQGRFSGLKNFFKRNKKEENQEQVIGESI